jgi:hypothetical protein
MSYLYEKTIDPVLYDLNVFFEKGFYNAYTNYGEEFLAEGVDLLKYFLEYNKSNVIVDPISSKVNIYESLDQEGIKTYTETQYKVWWYENFLTSMKQVRERFEAQLGDKVKFFKEISDSIGLLRNVDWIPNDSVISLIDIEMDNDQVIPVPVHSSVMNKLRPETENLIMQMSRANTSVYRHNMWLLPADYSGDSKTAHGEDLVPDYYHYSRLYNIGKSDLEADLSKHFGDVYELISWYETYKPQDTENNRQEMTKTHFTLGVQGIAQTVDMLKQEIDIYQNVVSFMDSLGVVSV